MDPFTIFLIGSAIVGAVIKLAEFGFNTLAAQTEKDRLNAQARETADQAVLDAEEALRQHVGQLGDEFSDYDSWYLAQVEEWNAGGAADSLEDYIRSEQVDELGQYGVDRARLESQVEIARQNLELASADTDEQFAFGEREYQAGVTASERTGRGEGAAAAAMGIRGGTGADTVLENQRVRMESLDLYLDRISWARDRQHRSIAISGQEVSNAETVGMGSLQQALVGARNNFDLNIAGINMDLTHYSNNLQADFDREYNLGNWALHTLGGAVEGAQIGASVFQTGINAKTWGYDANGDFWNNLDYDFSQGLGYG